MRIHGAGKGVAVLAAWAWTMGCGGGEDASGTAAVAMVDQEEEAPDAQNEEEAAQDEAEQAQDEDNGPEVLMPGAYEPGTAIPVALLQASYDPWTGEEVAMAGYPTMLHDGPLGDEPYLAGEADSRERIIQCTMEEGAEEEVETDKPVIVTGQVKGDFMGETVLLEDCRLVRQVDELDDVADAMPGHTDEERPMTAAGLHEGYFGWEGMEVTVEGRYHSQTTSTTSSGKTYRMDLADPDTNGKAVACTLDSEPPDSVSEDRDGVQVRGKVDGERFGMVSLSDCELLNRE